jgi:hypothetical protein
VLVYQHARCPARRGLLAALLANITGPTYRPGHVHSGGSAHQMSIRPPPAKQFTAVPCRTTSAHCRNTRAHLRVFMILTSH